MVDNKHTPPSMNQKIFKLNLPVETVSAYLLCCGINDTGETITAKFLMDVWNSSQEALEEALENLEKRNIVQRIISDGKGNDIYKLTDEKDWVISN